MDTYNLASLIEMVVRWTHVFAAILWIGQTYLFNFMEKSLESADDPNVVGKMWMVHGGGFYLLEKQRRPELMPMRLHWFKWEAAATWISGVILIGLTYYAGGLLVEPNQNYLTAALVGGGAIVLSWFVYDFMVRSPLGERPVVFGTLGLILILALHYVFRETMSSRAAYIHVGAVLGTIMAANVWMRILPSQRKMIRAAEKGESFARSIAETGPLRSRHNSYTVVPLVLLMISNHYPSVSYGHSQSTLIMALVFVAGWGVAALFRR